MAFRSLSAGLKRRLVVAALVALAVVIWQNRQPPPSIRDEMEAFIAAERVAGGAIAYGTIGTSPTALAVGMAGPERLMAVDDRFRLASLAKPITAAAVLTLVTDGQLSLDSTVSEAGAGVTVRHLLQHSGGWDREKTFDPIGQPSTVKQTGIAAPYSCLDLARRVPPAEFLSGTRYAYSNIGYCWLGHVVEQASGTDYATYVQQRVLGPRGATLEYLGTPTVDHVSNWPLAAYQALGPGGGWTGTVSDYWKFAAGPLDRVVRERPSYALEGKDYYGLGWRIWPDGTYSHFGAFAGAFAVVFRKQDRVMVAAFNGRPENDDAAFVKMQRLFERLD